VRFIDQIIFFTSFLGLVCYPQPCYGFEKLKIRNAVSGGEEMLRLRAYEKLQNLVTRGLVEKLGKEYKGGKRVREAHSEFATIEE
jgi:hypothetical protein